MGIRNRRALVGWLLLVAMLPISGPAGATHGGTSNASVDITSLSVSPAGFEIWTDGVCDPFTVTAMSGAAAAEGETVDINVEISDGDRDSDVGNDENRDLSLFFCDPDGDGPASNLGGPAPDPSTGAQTGNGVARSDCDDTNLTPNDGVTGCSDLSESHLHAPAMLHAECLTDGMGRCSFGLAVLDASTSESQTGSGFILAWADTDQDDVVDLGEVRDVESGRTRSGPQDYILVCGESQATLGEGDRVEFRCHAQVGPSRVEVDLTLDVISGPNAEEVEPHVCGRTIRDDPTTAQPDPSPSNPTPGLCGYNDSVGSSSPPGTDTVVICIQQPMSRNDPGTPFCDAHEAQVTRTITWVRGHIVNCTPDAQTVVSGSGEVLITCAITDDVGRPVPDNTTIYFTEEGPGYVTAPSCTTLSRAGSCSVPAYAPHNETGVQTITGTLKSGFCDANGQPVPGTNSACSDTVTVDWTTTQPIPSGSGTVTIRYRRHRPRGFTGIVASDRSECVPDRVVKVQRVGRGGVGRDETNGRGRYFVGHRRRPGRYRAVLIPRTITLDTGGELTCLGGRSPVIRIRRR